MTRELPDLAALTPSLLEIQQRWLHLGRPEQDALYATEFAEPFAALFRALPLHGAPENFLRPRALVSVLGFSWQPVALMAAWARPGQMLVLGTKESLSKRVGEEAVISLIARIAGIERDVIHPVEVGDPSETEIYRAVRDFLQRVDIPPRQIFVDPTGGKKSMSASTALAAFLAGAPLVYVDYGRYDAQKRIPVAGTEYPRLLANPLSVLGDLELQHVFAAFDRSDFAEALHVAQRLAERLYEPREAECIALLAEGYGAWDGFEFHKALERLEGAQEQINRFAEHGGWTWASRQKGGG